MASTQKYTRPLNAIQRQFLLVEPSASQLYSRVLPNSVRVRNQSSNAKAEVNPDTSLSNGSPIIRPEHNSRDLMSASPRLPRSVQAAYLRPLRRTAQHGVPACDLQLRSYSLRNLELMTDFAMRTAYYLGLPTSGPTPLPRKIERWTVSKSNFAHKKTQENFERITVRRLVQIQDADLDTVQIWLAFLRKHAYHGVGMKANVWEYEELGVGKNMDIKLQSLKDVINPKWAHFGRRRNPYTLEQVMEMLKERQLR